MMKKPLTPEEVAEVSLVTKGERYDHRCWPEDVVRAFASAEVVRAKGSHSLSADRARPSLGNLTKLLRVG